MRSTSSPAPCATRFLDLRTPGLRPRLRPVLLALLPLLSTLPSHAQNATASTAAVAPALATAEAAGASGSTGDWVTYKGDLQRTSARNIALPLPLNLIWRHSAQVQTGSASAPVVVGSGDQRRVYFSAGSTVFCIDGQTGASIWKSQVLTRPVTAPLLYIPGAATGAAALGGEAGGMIVAVTSGGQISALRTSDGGQIWTADTKSPIPQSAPIVARTANGDRLIVPLATGQLVAYTLAGVADPKWRIEALNAQGRVSPNATPALTRDGTRMFIPAQDQKLYSIDVLKGTVDYAISLPAVSTSAPMVLGEQVVMVAGGIVAGYRLRTGDPIWRFNTNNQVSASPAGIIDAQGRPIIYIGTRNSNTLYAIEGVKGTVLWKRDLGESVTGTASITTNAVVVGTSRGVVFALNPTDGSTVWQYRLRTERAAPVATGFGSGFGRGGAGGGGAGAGRGGGAGAGGFGGGTGRGGGAGGFGRGGATAPVVQTVYGVSAPPVIVDGQAYVMGDNVAVYCFDTQAFDSAPPRVVEPSVSVPALEGGLATLLVDANASPQLPGKAPMYFAAQIDDSGSGLDPASLQVRLNETPLPADRVIYSAGTGVLTIVLNPKDPAGGGTNLPDGTYNVQLSGKDYAGNALAYSGRIQVNNAVPSPPQQQQRPRGRRRGAGGAGGTGAAGGAYPGADGGGGGGFPGGDGGGFPGADGGGFPGGGFPGGGFPGGGFPGGGLNQ